ncbi:MAG TPA: SIMPL domain-containing protein [Phototrophicaceae bacterium]|nr:SIMPL domain-containing protein [Phototrophicaceae bacterium]
MSAQQSTDTPTPDSTLHTLTVGGTGTAYAPPDVAYVDLGVQTIDTDLATAFSKTGDSISSVLKALKALGIADADIQTSGINVSPQYQYDNNGNITGKPSYTVSNTIHVTVRQVDQVEKVLTDSVESGANTIQGLSFGIQDMDTVEAHARVQAVDDAKSRAQQLASELGVTLGKPLVVTETPQTTVPTPITFGARAGVAAVAPAASQPVSQGQLSVEVDVQITFSIS